jgi:hypothetical protein
MSERDDEHESTEQSGEVTVGGDRRRSPAWNGLRVWGWIPLLVISLAVVGAAWSLSSPIASSPDDDFHLGSVWCSRLAPNDVCEPSTRDVRTLDEDELASLDNGVRLVRVPETISQAAPCFAFDATKSAACQATLSSSILAESRANDGLYPGLYYELMGALVSEDVSTSVLSMRWINFAIATSLIVGAALCAPLEIRRAYVLASVTTYVPLGLFLFASNNPSGLAIAGVGAAFACAIGVLRQSSRQLVVTGAWAGTASVVAMGSRADAGVYIAIACACALILGGGWQRHLRWRAAYIIALAGVGLVCATLFSQTSAAADGIGWDSDAPLPTVLWNNVSNIPSLWTGSFGVGWGLGWLDTRVPDAVGVGITLVVGGLLLWGIEDVGRRKLLAASLALASITVLPLWLLGADRRFVGELVQPRYLLPMITVLVIIVLIPAQHVLRALRGPQLVAIGMVVTGAQMFALHANIRRYVTGQAERSPDLNTDIEWWWLRGPSPMATWIAGSLAFALVVALALTQGARALGSDDPPTTDEDDEPIGVFECVPASAVERRASGQHEDVLAVEADRKMTGPCAETDWASEL